MGTRIPLAIADSRPDLTPVELPAIPRDRLSLSQPLVALSYLLLTVAATALLLPGTPLLGWLYPAVPTLPALVLLFRRYAQADLNGALREMLRAALWMSLGMLLGFALLFRTPYALDTLRPELVPPVPNGSAYVVEMDRWIQERVGPEGDPRQFLPIHLTHFALVGVSSLLSAGVAAFYLGVTQLAYMNAYVFALVSHAPDRGTQLATLLFAWHLWSLVRVVSFITLATVCGYPLYARLRGRLIPWAAIGSWVRAAIALEIADIVLKAMLAEPTRQLLLRLGGFGT